MKKVRIEKTCALFLMLLVILSGVTILFRHVLLKRMEAEITQNIEENIEEMEEGTESIFQDGTIGIIKIPSIGVEAPICEGTGQEILKYTVRAF